MGGNSTETGKFTDFTIDDIKDYLGELKKLILVNQYTISRREENDAFAYKYRINTNKEKEISVKPAIYRFLLRGSKLQTGICT